MDVVLNTEQELFNELERLCRSPGYSHAIAYFCFRDNTITYVDGAMSVDDVMQQFSMERLVRTEISTLIGLVCKGDLDITHPGPQKIQEYIDITESLLTDIHKSMMSSMQDVFCKGKGKHKDEDANYNPFSRGDFLRESIFYGGESAYNFQYRDLSIRKYKNDNMWFVENKGYSIEQAEKIFSALIFLQNDKLNDLIPSQLDELSPDEWSMLPAFIFSIQELVDRSGVDFETVKKLIESFVCPPDVNKNVFSALDDFNPSNAYPIIRIDENVYLLFQNYGLMEALYETPFFWFNADESYKIKARENRGVFTEEFSFERLKLVFGEGRVFTNVNLYKGKNRVGEIDVLVVFSNRAIVLQAKSKKLTIAARKGNDNSLQDDFKNAVQSAYDQAFICSNFLNDESCRLVDSSGKELLFNRDFQEIYPFCVVSEHYPALSFQARQFLKYQRTEEIKPPFVMDVFLLDVMSEMLQSPLYFLSYINRRVEYSERILSNHELTILSYHLKHNLWVDNDISMIQLEDDICADLDLAMLTRRNSAPGKATPEGILTKYKNTTYGHLIDEISGLDDASTIDLGFMLLSLSGDAIEKINDGIDHLCKFYMNDGKSHDFTLLMDEGGSGLTIHCNNDAPSLSGPRLRNHCYKRKYASKANLWFGLCIDPLSRKIRFGLELKFNWEKSDAMDELTKNMPVGQNLKNGRKINFNTKRRYGKKVGRNELCPCGSRLKYKKCCL